MEPVGFWGIIKLTIQIIRKSFKHFLCIAILCAIPHALHLPVLDLSCSALDILIGAFFTLRTLIVSKPQSPSPAPAILPPQVYNIDDAFPPVSLSSVYPFFASLLLSITLLLISYPLLTFSVCRACLNKSFSLQGSLLGVPKSAKHLALTSLCIGAVVLGFTAMAIGLMGLIAGVAVVTARINDAATASIIFAISAVIGGMAWFYLTISFSLAHTVAILEERMRGWRAMMRSLELLNGRKWVALGLVSMVYGMMQTCEFSVLWQWRGASIVRVSLQSLITLFGMVAQVVLYMSCKSHRQEPLNTLVAANSCFGPHKSSPESQSMDVETAAFLPALPN